MTGPPDDSDGAEGRMPTRTRARRMLILVLRCYLFGAAIVLIVRLLGADTDPVQLLIDALFWPHTLGEIARTL